MAPKDIVFGSLSSAVRRHHSCMLSLDSYNISFRVACNTMASFAKDVLVAESLVSTGIW